MKKILIKELGNSATRKNNRKEGDPTLLFEANEIHESSHILTRLVRAICYLEKITYGDLDQALRKRIASQNRPANKISSAKPNLMKAIKSNRITFDKTVELLQTILGYDFDIYIKIKKRGGKPVMYNYQDAINEVVRSKKALKL